MADNQRTSLAIKILNVLAFVFFFGSNLFTALGGPTTGYYGQKQTYITPAAGTFWIWTLINFLFLGFVIFQFFTDKCIDVVGWRFIGIGVLQSIWIHVFINHHYIFAFIFAAIVTALVSHVYWDLRTQHRPSQWGELAFIHLPFSLLHAYLVFLLVLSAFTAFGVDASQHKAGVATKVLVILALAFLTATSIGYAFHDSKGDVAGALVIALELGGVYSQVKHPASIHYAALVAFVLTLFAVAKALFFTFRKGGITNDDPERAPLVG